MSRAVGPRKRGENEPETGRTLRVSRALGDACRRFSAPWRALPDFLVIGAQRAGTTSLSRYLGRHPGVWIPAAKEVHYFDHNARRDLNWYRAHFPLRRWARARARELGHSLVLGEASPYYLFHPLVPERVRIALPEVRLVCLLRNPVERALSHFRHERKRGFEPIEEFRRALELEARRLEGAEDRLVRAGRDEAHNHFSYLARGDYAPQLERWFAHFGRERVLVIRSEDIFDRPAASMDSLMRFLGIPALDLGPFPTLNGTEETGVESEARADLVRHFRPRIERLETLLGRRMGWLPRA